MTLKSNVKKGVSLSIHYFSLFQAFRSCGRRKQMWAGEKNSDGPVSYFPPHLTIPAAGLRQANIWIKMYKS